MGENGEIGLNNKLPWHLPSDLKYFKEVTMDKMVVMGRKTYESIGRPLPGRVNVVLTRDRDFTAEGVWIYNSVSQLLKDTPDSELFVIGGSTIYKIFMPHADKLYITHVNGRFQADSFVDIDWDKWNPIFVNHRNADELNEYAHDFTIYTKKGKLR